MDEMTEREQLEAALDHNSRWIGKDEAAQVLAYFDRGWREKDFRSSHSRRPLDVVNAAAVAAYNFLRGER